MQNKNVVLLKAIKQYFNVDFYAVSTNIMPGISKFVLIVDTYKHIANKHINTRIA